MDVEELAMSMNIRIPSKQELIDLAVAQGYGTPVDTTYFEGEIFKDGVMWFEASPLPLMYAALQLAGLTGVSAISTNPNKPSTEKAS